MEFSIPDINIPEKLRILVSASIFDDLERCSINIEIYWDILIVL